MSDIIKGAALLVIAGAVGYQAINAVDIDSLAHSPDKPKPDVHHFAFDPEKHSSEVEAILAGADPTDVLEPTAAGKRMNILCDSGVIAGDLNANRFSKISYASIDHEGVTYIQVSRYAPAFLVQEKYQTVSATEIKEDDLPDSIRDQLARKINDPGSCTDNELYLSKIKYLD